MSKPNRRGKKISKRECLVMGEVSKEECLCIHKTRRRRHVLSHIAINSAVKSALMTPQKYFVSEFIKLGTTNFWNNIPVGVRLPKSDLKEGHHLIVQCPVEKIIRYSPTSHKVVRCNWMYPVILVMDHLSRETKNLVQIRRRECLHRDGFLLYCSDPKCEGSVEGTILGKHKSEYMKEIPFVCGFSDVKTGKTCNKEKCFHCGASPFHYGKTCQEAKTLHKFAIDLKSDRDTVLSTIQILRECQLCPQCSVPVSKTEGCDHMQCGKCGTHFCWRCVDVLPEDGGYGDHIKIRRNPETDEDEFVCKGILRTCMSVQNFETFCKEQNLKKLFGQSISDEHYKLILTPP